MTPHVWITSCDYSAYTVQSLNSILATVPADVPVGIVDDCSSPPHLEALRAAVATAPREVMLVSHPTRSGQTYGYNVVLDRTPEDCPIVLLNNDTITGVGWLQPLLDGIGPGVGIVSPCSNQPGHVPRQQVRTYLPYEIDFDPNDPQNVAKTAAVMQDADPPYVELDKINGFTFMITPEARRVVGRFDPRKPMAGNEDNYRGRCAEAGLRRVLATRSFVYHYKDVTLHRKVHRVGRVHRIPGA